MDVDVDVGTVASSRCHGALQKYVSLETAVASQQEKEVMLNEICCLSLDIMDTQTGLVNG